MPLVDRPPVQREILFSGNYRLIFSEGSSTKLGFLKKAIFEKLEF